MKSIISFLVIALTALCASPALASDQGLTKFEYINVKSSYTKAEGKGKSSAMTYRRRKAVESGMAKALKALKKVCKKKHASDKVCAKKCKAKNYKKGHATLKDVSYQRTCNFYSGKPKHVEECRKKKKPSIEEIVARGKCACKCSSYHAPK